MGMKAGKMMLDCNGVKHQVVLAKNAKIVIDNKPAKLADLTKLQKSSTKITVHGKCGKGTEFTAEKITASTKPQNRRAPDPTPRVTRTRPAAVGQSRRSVRGQGVGELG